MLNIRGFGAIHKKREHFAKNWHCTAGICSDVHINDTFTATDRATPQPREETCSAASERVGKHRTVPWSWC